ncbi:hypothetical protein [uncultured Dokdonia sp.]|uniref:hypothetical protein n=1 Tax=uncultured Dokdonia sp. TaxID=575653 RepID=UPI002626A37F|nr:hypothetical protein [uncultured Dokdonia sp.]
MKATSGNQGIIVKKEIFMLLLLAFTMNPIFSQEKKSRKEIKLEKKKAKFEAQKKAMEIGQFGFAIRKLLSSNIGTKDFVAGIVYVRGDQGQLDEVVWYNSINETVRLNNDFNIINYYVVPSSNSQKMTASYQGVINGKRYSFVNEIAFGEKPKLKITDSDGIEIWYTGVFDTRN